MENDWSYFNVHGVRVGIELKNEFHKEVYRKIKNDFDMFAKKDRETQLDVNVSIDCSNIEKVNQGRFGFKFKMGNVSWQEGSAFVNYGQSTFCLSNHGDKASSMRFFGDDSELMYEVLYTSLNSVIGEKLDKKGFHRIHALGFKKNNICALLVLPSGGGKSSLGLLLSKLTDVVFFGEECPLVKGENIFPFPLHGAIKKDLAELLSYENDLNFEFKRRLYPAKYTFYFPKSKISNSAPLNLCIVGTRTEGAPRITETSRFRVFMELTRSLAIGLGLPQMKEHMIRPNNVGGIIKIFYSRIKQVIQTTFGSRPYLFYYNENVFENYESLVSFIESLDGEIKKHEI